MNYDRKSDTFLLSDDSTARVAGHPLSICLVLGYRCDLDCHYCLNPEGDRTDFPAVNESLLKLLSKWAPMRVVLTGGEPTLYPTLMSWTGEALKRMGHSIIVSTHGLHFQHLVSADWVDRINVSIPGLSKKTYQAMRGIDGFDRAVEGIRTMAKAGKEITINFTVAPHNLSEVPLAVNFAEDLGATVLGYEIIFKIGRARKFSASLTRQEFAHTFEKVPESRNVKVLFPSVGRIFELVKAGLIVVELNGHIYSFSTEPGYLITAAEHVLLHQETALSSHLKANRHLHMLSAEDGKREFWNWCRQGSRA